MNLIPQNEVDSAALKYAQEYVEYDEQESIDEGDLLEYAQYDFKAGVSFAESKFEDLAIEFADWINVSKQGFHSLYRKKNSSEPICWAESFVGGRIDYTSKDLYQQFIKDRNNEP